MQSFAHVLQVVCSKGVFGKCCAGGKSINLYIHNIHTQIVRMFIYIEVWTDRNTVGEHPTFLFVLPKNIHVMSTLVYEHRCLLDVGL